VQFKDVGSEAAKLLGRGISRRGESLKRPVVAGQHLRDEARGATAAGTWLREAAFAYLRASHRKPSAVRGQQVVVPRPEPKLDPGQPPPQS
jgi:hypothetical protein